MSSYQPLIKLITQYQPQLVAEVVDQCLHLKLSAYIGLSVEEISKRIETIFINITDYLENEDPHNYRAYVRQISEERLSGNFAPEDINTVMGLIAQSLTRLIKRNFPGDENKLVRQSYYQRLLGLQNLAKSTIVAVRARQLRNNP